MKVNILRLNNVCSIVELWHYGVMSDRWDRLFDDMAAQLRSDEAHARTGKMADATEEGFAEQELSHRLAGAVGQPVRIWVGDELVEGFIDRVGKDWTVVRVGSGQPHLVLLTWVVRVRVGARVHAQPGMFSAQSVLRQWARARYAVRVDIGVAIIEGEVDAVASDYVQLLSQGVFDVVPLAAIRSVRVIGQTAT